MNINVYFVLNVLFVSSSFILNLETGLSLSTKSICDSRCSSTTILLPSEVSQ
jgi:hypothetical protein